VKIAEWLPLTTTEPGVSGGRRVDDGVTMIRTVDSICSPFAANPGAWVSLRLSNLGKRKCRASAKDRNAS